jgi:hypothetical protein
VKGVPEFNTALTILESKYDNVEVTPIINMSWAEAIRAKRNCNITIDTLTGIPGYGNTSIESMFLRHAVLSKLDEYTKMLYPDIPIYDVKDTPETVSALSALIENKDLLISAGELGNKFVLKYHHPEIVVEMWEHLINHVTSQ